MKLRIYFWQRLKKELTLDKVVEDFSNTLKLAIYYVIFMWFCCTLCKCILGI